MVYNKEQIKQIIPHREPMLMIDEIIQLNPESGTVTGKKTFRRDEALFQGCSVIPNVFLIEALAQTGACAVFSRSEYAGRTSYFALWDKIEFYKNVLPEDTVILKVRFTRLRGKAHTAYGEAYVGEEKAAQGSFTCVIG